jgi:hypothetical protein
MAKRDTDQLRRFARLGAMARLEQLRIEEAAIRAQFPELFGRGSRAPVAVAPAGGRRKGRRAMSAAERRVVSARMKKYWAARRKAKGTK